MANYTKPIHEKIPGFRELWEESREAGGTYAQFGARVGISGERVRQIVKELGLTPSRGMKARAEIFLEELEFLHSMGRGVHEISKALGMEPDALVRKVDDMHYAGKTKVLFHGWHRRYDKEAA